MSSKRKLKFLRGSKPRQRDGDFTRHVVEARARDIRPRKEMHWRREDLSKSQGTAFQWWEAREVIWTPENMGNQRRKLGDHRKRWKMEHDRKRQGVLARYTEETSKWSECAKLALAGPKEKWQVGEAAVSIRRARQQEKQQSCWITTLPPPGDSSHRREECIPSSRGYGESST